jgi:hypothetical protein
MGSLSKQAVMDAINEEAEGRRKRQEPERRGGMAGAIIEKVGGMLAPKRKGGAKSDRGEYLRYVDKTQSDGKRAKSFAEWSSSDED